MYAIDFSSHIIPKEIVKEFKFVSYAKIDPNNYDPEYRIKLMGKYNISVQVIHLAQTQIYGLDPIKAENLCKKVNDIISSIVNKYPQRFVGSGIVTLYDIGFAIDELNRLYNDLGLKCVTIATHYGEKSLDYSEYRPFFQKISSLGIPIFLHPINWEGYGLVEDSKDPGFMRTFGWPFDTTQAIWKMIVSGLLDEYPNLKIVTHHLGGMFPFYKLRAYYRLYHEGFGKNLKRDFYDYFGKQIFADTAIDGGSVEILMTGYSLFGSKGILFGSDWPFVNEELSIINNIRAIELLPLTKEEKENILWRNAKDILKIDI
jgi:predicted TIM-barrel fold metal-dependent hydrolase